MPAPDVELTREQRTARVRELRYKPQLTAEESRELAALLRKSLAESELRRGITRARTGGR